MINSHTFAVSLAQFPYCYYFTWPTARIFVVSLDQLKNCYFIWSMPWNLSVLLDQQPKNCCFTCSTEQDVTASFDQLKWVAISHDQHTGSILYHMVNTMILHCFTWSTPWYYTVSLGQHQIITVSHGQHPDITWSTVSNISVASCQLSVICYVQQRYFSCIFIHLYLHIKSATCTLFDVHFM